MRVSAEEAPPALPQTEPMAAAPIVFCFDFSSPYSYIASEWIEALAARHGRTVDWRAILLGALFQAAELKSPVSYPLKREYSMHDFERSARFAGVPLKNPVKFPIPTQNAARVFWWLQARGDGSDSQWARHCLRAYFARGVDLSDADALKALATEFGLDAAEAEAVWNDPAWKARLKAANDAAIAAGVFGAPFFVIDGEPFWGNDRRAQIERWLASGPF
jgi:2-hydroxychromene-2-carboxylate isomerase